MAELNAWLKQWENNLVNLEKPHKKELKISYLRRAFEIKKSFTARGGFIEAFIADCLPVGNREAKIEWHWPVITHVDDFHFVKKHKMFECATYSGTFEKSKAFY